MRPRQSHHTHLTGGQDNIDNSLIPTNRQVRNLKSNMNDFERPDVRRKSININQKIFKSD